MHIRLKMFSLTHHLALNSCIQLHADLFGYILFQNALYGWLGWARFCTAACGCICANVHILLKIDVNSKRYGRISLNMDCIWMCWIIWLHMVAFILKYINTCMLLQLVS